MPGTILIVEDEPKLAGVLNDYLKQAGFETVIVSDGLQVMPQFLRVNPVLILLDLMLPGRDGLEICREIRSFSAVPVIMVTARIEEVDRIIGLELGADDYVCKPYSPREVVTRVKTVLRRSVAQVDSRGHEIALDEATYQIRVREQDVVLTAVEFKLMQLLMSAPGRIYNRQQLMDHIYSDDRIVSDRTIDSHVKKLRRKLAEAASDLELIYSIYGVGYKFEPPDFS